MEPERQQAPKDLVEPAAELHARLGHAIVDREVPEPHRLLEEVESALAAEEFEEDRVRLDVWTRIEGLQDLPQERLQEVSN